MLIIVRMALALLLAAIASPGYSAQAVCPPGPENPTPEVVQAARRNASDHGYLWRITKDGHTSYLYGTMHVAKPDWMFPGPHVLQALRATDTVALELDVMDPDIQERMKKGMAGLHGAPLPEPLAKRIRQQAESLCVPYDQLAGVPPEMQVDTLGMLAARWEGLDAAYAIDAVLAGLGHGSKRNMVSLETPELQLQAMLMKTPAETAAYVEDSLDELESSRSRALIKRLSQAWANADYVEMEHFTDWCECLKTATERETMKRLLDDRNPALADKIDALHKDGKRVFAAVGSAHMFGPVGLPALMEKRGYTVERVDMKSAPGQ